MTDPHAPARDELPLLDYDHLTTGDLPTRIGGLDAAAIDSLLAYEREHANRLPVVQILERRRAALDAGAEPSGPVPAQGPPGRTSPSAGSKVSPQTSGPPVNPPSHGDPTNPAQPR